MESEDGKRKRIVMERGNITLSFVRAVGVVAVAGGLLVGGTAQADSVSKFYKGKSVTVIVGFSAGGTYTLYTRLLARHLSKHLPGAPKFIVQNMPGGGGFKSTNYAYNVALRDAFDKMVADTDYIADAEKRGAYLASTRGVDVQAAVKEAMGVDRAVVDVARKAMFPK